MGRVTGLPIWILILGCLLGIAHPASAVVAFDAASSSLRTGTTDPHTWTHTPVGTPRGVICGASHGATSTTHMVSMTYGGVGLTMLQRQTDTAGEPGVSEVWFVGAGLPTGAQTVSVDLDSATTDDIQFACITATAGADTEVGSRFCANGQNLNEANPTCTITNSVSSVALMSAYTGAGAPGTCGGSTTTSILATDHGAFASIKCRSGVLATNITCTHTVVADDQALACAAMTEVAGGGGGGGVKRLLTLGVGD